MSLPRCLYRKRKEFQVTVERETTFDALLQLIISSVDNLVNPHIYFLYVEKEKGKSLSLINRFRTFNDIYVADDESHQFPLSD